MYEAKRCHVVVITASPRNTPQEASSPLSSRRRNLKPTGLSNQPKVTQGNRVLTSRSVFCAKTTGHSFNLGLSESLLEVLYKNVSDLLNFMTEIKMTKILFFIIVRKISWNVFRVCLIKDRDKSKFMRSVEFELLRGQAGALWGQRDRSCDSGQPQEAVLNSENVPGHVFWGKVLLMFFFHWSGKK